MKLWLGNIKLLLAKEYDVTSGLDEIANKGLTIFGWNMDLIICHVRIKKN